MTKRLSRILFALALALTVGLTACGDDDGDDGGGGDSTDNVAACEDAQTSLDATYEECGASDSSFDFSCDNYANTPCDVSAYFDCINSHTTCEDGTISTEGIGDCQVESCN